MRIIIVSLIALIVSACASEDLVKRYKTVDYAAVPTKAGEYVTAKVNAYPLAPKPGKGVTDLSNHGQEAFIAALAEKEKDCDKFVSRIMAPFPDDQPKKRTISRKVVISINKETNNRADRIDSIRLTLSLKDSGKIWFSSWDKIVTNYSSIDIGKLTLGKTSSFAFTPEVGGDITVKLGSLSYGRSQQEEIGIKDRLVLTGTLTDDKAILFEQGVPGMDLSGNLIADMEFEGADLAAKNVMKFDHLFDEKGAPITDDKAITMIETVVSYPNLAGDIKGRLEFEYVLRHVKKGAETYPEGDDEIVFQTGIGKVDDFILAKKDDFALKTVRIWDGKDYMHMRVKGREKAMVIDFPSYDDADAFLRWLTAVRPNAVKGNEIRIGPDKIIADEDFDKLRAILHKIP